MQIQLGATAGLRFLGPAESEAILAAVRTYLREKTPFKVRSRADLPAPPLVPRCAALCWQGPAAAVKA